jgi:hypothetical protein
MATAAMRLITITAGRRIRTPLRSSAAISKMKIAPMC